MPEMGLRTGGSDLASSNGPNWLIRNDDLFPVVFLDGLVYSFKLLCHDFDSRALLSLF